MPNWLSIGASDVGSRRSVNEDRMLLQPQKGLWAIADGMGGYAAGDIASQKVIDHLEKVEFEQHTPAQDLILKIEQAFAAANSDIRQYAHTHHLDTIGSTVVSVAFVGKLGICAWMGDSRLYRMRGSQIAQISTDHSLVQELINYGEITPSQATHHPARNVITRAIGSETQVAPDIQLFIPQKGDIYILCSDGMYHAVSPTTWATVFKSKTIEHAVPQMISEALSIGADDNLSIIAIQIDPENE